MAFTYDFTTAPAISYVRLLIADTDAANPVFQDAEINAAYSIQQSQFQSSMFYSGAGGAYLPSTPVSYLRVAALLLDSLAANKSRLGAVTKILDVTLDVAKAAAALRDQAKAYRETDDDAGAFAIIEWCTTDFAVRDRWWKQLQRGTVGV